MRLGKPFITFIAVALLISMPNFSFAENILCPTQKRPSCAEIHPSQAMQCERSFCNIVSQGNVCMWSCAAHFEDFSVNGIPMSDLLDAYKAKSKQQ
jgi:hypothetical protein